MGCHMSLLLSSFPLRAKRHSEQQKRRKYEEDCVFILSISSSFGIEGPVRKWKNLLHMSSLDKNEANVPINSRAQKELLFHSVLPVVGLRAVGIESESIVWVIFQLGAGEGSESVAVRLELVA